MLVSNKKLKQLARNKSTIIWFNSGMRGNSIYRIIAAHPEVFWNEHVSLNSEEFTSHPLDLPDSIANMFPPLNYDINKKVNKWQFSYSTYHTISFVDDDKYLQVVKSWIESKSYIDKKLFSASHVDFFKYNLMSIDDKPHIWLYGTCNRLGRDLVYYQTSPNPLAYNLNIDALYSQNYETFEAEYYKLINHFNLTSCLNRVRAFILLNLERDKYISKFY